MQTFYLCFILGNYFYFFPPLHSSLTCIKNVEEFTHLKPEKGAGKAFHYIYLRLF